ncbi:MAG: gerKA [Bacilli bacterium]|nr:gerKA [Bacilli bacterium]
MSVFKKKMRSFFRSNSRKPPNNSLQMNPPEQMDPQEQDLLSADLNENMQMLHTIYANCSDVVFRPFLISGKTKALLLYIAGLSNIDSMEQHVLVPLMQETAEEFNNLSQMIEQKISVPDVKEIKTIKECIDQISMGNPIVLIEHAACGLSLSLAKWEKRAVEEPTAETVIRGPREGFSESIRVNTSLLRRRLRSPKLKMQSMTVGRYTQTEIIIAFIEGIVDKALVEEVLNRLQRIDIDGIFESAYIEEMIEDSPFSIFPQLMNTERPDVAAANLLEGRVAILIDGSPAVLIAPITFYSLLQSPEDYYQRFLFSTATRWLRYLALVISLLLPSLYISILTFHQEMIPTSLFLSIAKSREEIPFPAIVEALIMEITFEALREAGIRLPKQVGSAVSIVGALVIGQSAVQAGIISAPMVMVVAITGITSFMIPRYSAGIAIRLLRFPIMLLSGTLGLLGLMLAVIVIIVHMCTLRSFGVPYLSPMGPMKGRDMKDVLMRAPLWMLNTRPYLSGEGNKYRQSPGQKPDPNKGTE